jgi:multimeric flavodoxin WrbA
MTGDFTRFTDFPCFDGKVCSILASKSDAMQIIIVNGNPDGEFKSFESYLADYKNRLNSAGHNVRIIILREMKLGFCKGCFNCWHTTPGICSIDDDIKVIHRAVINADLVVWAGPLIKGYISSLLKKVQERMIPLLHPYVELVNGEIHHRKRYGHYPGFGVIVGKEPDTVSEEMLITQKIQERYALNFRSTLNFFLTTETTVSEAIRETIKSVRSDNKVAMDFEPMTGPALSLYISSLN